jgi:hypothetical protein
MKHARDEYNDIKELDKRIPADEPVVLLRAQDELAWKALEYYIKLRKEAYFKDGGTDEMGEQLLKHADKMREWPEKKMADMPVQEKAEKKSSSEGTKTQRKKSQD